MGFLRRWTMIAVICAAPGSACLSSPPAAPGDGGADPVDARAVPEGPVLLYSFDEAGGATVFDQSGIEPAVDLLLDDLDTVSWGDGFLTLSSPTRLVAAEPPVKLVELCKEGNQLTVEVWIATPHVSQPADSAPQRILSFSDDAYATNFMIGQEVDEWVARVRTTDTEPGGEPSVYSASSVAANSLTHLVFVRGDDGRDHLFLDGELNAIETDRQGTLEIWDPMFAMTVGNENMDERPWLGDIHAIAVYARALSAEEVQVRFLEGPR